MESRAKLFGHPVHQMLIVFPLGLLATALAFDAVTLATANGYWSELAYWMIAAGVVTGLIAAPFGLAQSRSGGTSPSRAFTSSRHCRREWATGWSNAAYPSRDPRSQTSG